MSQYELLEIIQKAKFKNWTELDLSNKGIEVLPPEIGEITSLEQLDLSRNQLLTVPVSIGKLTSLQKLDLSTNQLKDIPVEIGKLTHLQELSLSSNQIYSLPYEIGNLNKLELLNLQDNRLFVLPSEIGNLTALKYLSLQRNMLTRLPDNLGKLTRLQMLILSNNKLNDLPDTLGKLTNLRDLYLEDNCLVELPVDLGMLQKIYRIKLNNNPLEIPPMEIVDSGVGAIINYLQQLKKSEEKGEKVQLYEAKLLIVGAGDVGKTHLTHRLIYGQLPRKNGTTRGIDIHKWVIKTQKSKNFRVNFWDFGGQQILHSTHQFFLTKRSLYLFVWDARKDEDQTNFDYWLNIIKLLSDNSPVLVVMNKADQRIKNIDENMLQQTFQNIHGYYKVSADYNKGIDSLRENIVQEINTLELVGTSLPKAWVDIRARLEELRKTHITCDEYLEICNNHGLKEEQAYYLSDYYHDLGVILHFKDNPILKTIVFLHPEWTTEAVYKVVEDLDIQKSNGLFSYEKVQSVWHDNNYPRDIHPQLLELMKKFELCFQLDNTNEYIVPELLPGNRPNINWDEQDSIMFLYKYTFMPAGILTRLIVRLHDLHKEQLYWKHGVVLEWEGDTLSLITSEPINRLLRIRIQGSKSRELLAIIRRNLNQIHNTLNNPEVSQLLPCICRECSQSSNPYLHRYQDLMKAKEKEKQKTECKNSYEDVTIEDILGKYIIHKVIEKRNFDVFMCYNSEDENEVKKIGENLKKKSINPWLDEWELRPGLPWQDILEEQIEDIKSVAVFIGSDGIGPWQRIEQRAFIEQFVNRRCPVIPVILSNCKEPPKLPVFLKQFQYIDFRKKEPDPMQQLLWGITGKKPKR